MVLAGRLLVYLITLWFVGSGSNIVNAAGPVAATGTATTVENVSYQNITALPWREADHRLSYGPQPLQFGGLWLPESANADNPAPLVIFVHGGCWLSAYDIRHSYPLSTALADTGFAVWSLEYRRSGDAGGGWPGSLEDVIAGISHIRQLQNFPVDLERVVLTGHSAGGHLALLAARHNDLPALDGIIGLAAITDIAEYALGDSGCQKAAAGFMGGSPLQVPEAYQQAEISADKLPLSVYLLHGEQDSIVAPAQSDGFEHHILPRAGHFDWLHPQTPAYGELINRLHGYWQDPTP
jgi:acetyl esterase/lipase